MRAVFDPNVVLSALVFGRRPSWLRRAWAGGIATPIVCRETVTELLHVLAYPKFRLNKAEREALLAEYLPYAEIVILPEERAELSLACRHRKDAVFLHLALASGAEVLVSGDKDLSVLGEAYPVISPGMLRKRLEGRSGT